MTDVHIVETTTGQEHTEAVSTGALEPIVAEIADGKLSDGETSVETIANKNVTDDVEAKDRDVVATADEELRNKVKKMVCMMGGVSGLDPEVLKAMVQIDDMSTEELENLRIMLSDSAGTGFDDGLVDTIYQIVSGCVGNKRRELLYNSLKKDEVLRKEIKCLLMDGVLVLSGKWKAAILAGLHVLEVFASPIFKPEQLEPEPEADPDLKKKKKRKRSTATPSTSNSKRIKRGKESDLVDTDNPFYTDSLEVLDT